MPRRVWVGSTPTPVTAADIDSGAAGHDHVARPGRSGADHLLALARPERPRHEVQGTARVEVGLVRHGKHHRRAERPRERVAVVGTEESDL